MKKKILLIVLALVILAVSIVFAKADIPEKVYDEKVIPKEDVIGEVTEGLEVIQRFSTDKKIIDAISIKCGTYDRENTGHILYSLQTIDGEELYNGSYDVSKIKNNKENRIKFDKRVYNDEKELQLVIKGDSTQVAENAITIYAYVKCDKNSSLSINGEDKKQTLNVKIITNEWSLKRFIYLYITMMLMYIYLAFILKTIKQK